MGILIGIAALAVVFGVYKLIQWLMDRSDQKSNKLNALGIIILIVIALVIAGIILTQVVHIEIKFT